MFYLYFNLGYKNMFLISIGPVYNSILFLFHVFSSFLKYLDNFPMIF